MLPSGSIIINTKNNYRREFNMSATKRRNLKKKIIGCLCLAAIAASMTAAPVVPVISNVSVISASAETIQTAVDLSQIASYVSAPPAGVTVTYEESAYYKIALQNGYNYTFSGENSADVQIYVPSDVTADINFNNATIINDEGRYYVSGDSFYSSTSIGANNCVIVNYVVPFKVDGTLRASGSLSVDTYSYYGECNAYPDPPVNQTYHDGGHQWTAPIKEGSGAINGYDFFIVKYVDENGKIIDQNFYLKDNVYTVTTLPKYYNASNNPTSIGDFPCLSFTGGSVSADKIVYARTTHTDSDSNGLCDNCGAAVQRTVTFETDGGSAIASATVPNGQKLTAPTAPTKTGCTFDGWYTDAACTIPYDFNSAVTSDFTLYAKWVVEVDLSQIVNYRNGSTTCPAGVTAAYGDDDHNIIELKLADGSYKFKGTNLVSGAYVDVKIIVPTGVTASIEFAEGSSIINDNGIYALTNGFYSQHHLGDDCYIREYSVPFNVEAGGSLTVSGSLSVDTYSYYGECCANPNPPDNETYHDGGHRWTVPLSEGGGTFTANYFTVKYVDENNKVIDENYYLGGKTYNITTLPKYYNDENQYDPNDQASINAFPCVSFTGGTVSGNKTVTARTTHTDPDSNGKCTNCGRQLVDTYTVTFETNGGSEVTAAQVTNGNTISEPTVPTRSGYKFEGWYTDRECTVSYDFNSPVTGDITLYAKWKSMAITSISVNTPPAKTFYMEGYSFDPTGLVISVTHEDSTTENVAYSAANASEFTFSPSGKLTTANRAVTITYGGKTTEQAITVNSIPSPPSRPSSSSDSTTPTTPVVKEDNEPKIDGKSGWDNISDKIDKTPDGGTVNVDMNGTTELPKDIVKDIAGKNIDLVLDMGNGITWTINGKDVTNPKTVDLSVKANVKAIPMDIINNVTGEKYSIQISLAHDGDFGFTATLTVDLGSKNNGYYANLFYYNEDKKDLEFADYSKISGGKANLVFTHASDWAIVIDKEVLGVTEDVSAGTSIATETDTLGTAGRRGIAGAVMSLTAALAAGAAVAFKRKARK